MSGWQVALGKPRVGSIAKTAEVPVPLSHLALRTPVHSEHQHQHHHRRGVVRLVVVAAAVVPSAVAVAVGLLYPVVHGKEGHVCTIPVAL